MPEHIAPDAYTEIQLAERPTGLPGDATFKIVERPFEEPEEGEIVVRITYLSLDPAMRGWMDDRRSYLPPVGIGEVMRGLAVGEVVRSRHPDIAAGDHVSGSFGWRQYARVAGKEANKLAPGVDWKLALGPLGMVGMTAYFGLLDVGAPKEGDTVLVSGAAGAVGTLVCQIAKLKGCRVVGLAGGAEKCRFLEDDLGIDVAIDYKAIAKTAGDLGDAIRTACPKGVDIYFDNVGGAVLDAALRNIARGARVVICGAISQYNATEGVKGPENYLALLVQRARMEGFIVFDFAPRYGDAAREIVGWLQAGKIQYRYDVVDGLEAAPRALLRLFDGSNTGKLLVRVDPQAT